MKWSKTRQSCNIRSSYWLTLSGTPIFLTAHTWCIIARCKSSMDRTCCCPAQCWADNSCSCRKQALSWDSYHESHELAWLQVLSRVRLKNNLLTALNLMLRRWEGKRRVGANTDKTFLWAAYWKETAGTKESKDFQPAESDYPSRILSATAVWRKTPLNLWHNPKDSFHPPASQLSMSPQGNKYLALRLQTAKCQDAKPQKTNPNNKT